MFLLEVLWRVKVCLGFGKVGCFENLNKMVGCWFYFLIGMDDGRKELMLWACLFARLGKWVCC